MPADFHRRTVFFLFDRHRIDVNHANRFFEFFQHVFKRISATRRNRQRKRNLLHAFRTARRVELAAARSVSNSGSSGRARSVVAITHLE